MANTPCILVVNRPFLIRLTEDPWKRIIYHAAGKVLTHPDDQDDAFLETVAAFAKKQGHFIYLTGKTESYIWGFARNKAREIWRKDCRRRKNQARFAEDAAASESEEKAPLAALEESERRQQLKAAITSLPQRYQTVVMLLMSGRSNRACAQQMGVSVDTWYKLSERSRTALRKELG